MSLIWSIMIIISIIFTFFNGKADTLIELVTKASANSIENIKQWSKQIKNNSSFSLTTAPLLKKHKIRLYDLTLCAGIGNNIDDNVPYTEYETDEMNCDFALKVYRHFLMT